MGWAERLKKNKHQCAACEKAQARHLPHFVVDVGAMCDECYRKMTRVLDRIDGKPQHVEVYEYGNHVVQWDRGRRRIR